MKIYLVENLINHKIYIGKTINDSPDYLGSGILIKAAIKKYGKENFSKTILDAAASVEELNEKEKYWIHAHQSTDLTKGYNIGLGGDGGDLFTNNPNKEEIRKKYSHKGSTNPMYGKTHTEETKQKISIKNKGKRAGIPTWNKGKSIKEYSPKYKERFEKLRISNPYSSREFLFISPDGEMFKVFGGYIKFCKLKNLDVYSSRHFINKGKIPTPQKGTPSELRKNLIGWEIKYAELHPTKVSS